MTASRHPLTSLIVAAAAIVTLALGGVAGASSPGAHAQRLPMLSTGSGAQKVRPTTIEYTGDGSGIIGRLPNDVRAASKRPGFLHWTSWTGTHADAKGTVWLKSCNPFCAVSPFYSYPLTLTAGRVRNGHFTRLTLRYRYHGRTVVDRRCVPDRGRDQGYRFVIHGRCQ